MSTTIASPTTTSAGLALRALAMPLALLAIFAYFAIQSPAFLSSRNLSMLGIEVSITAVLALGMFLVILRRQWGRIDRWSGRRADF